MVFFSACFIAVLWFPAELSHSNVGELVGSRKYIQYLLPTRRICDILLHFCTILIIFFEGSDFIVAASANDCAAASVCARYKTRIEEKSLNYKNFIFFYFQILLFTMWCSFIVGLSISRSSSNSGSWSKTDKKSLRIVC